ncbi:zinc-binding dehydrogenase [Ammoniphilus sp. 3BR4]|uniref:zinc-dependent alcohol dehydrogenase n=1 Tax=Ammoniphilus sp. 3BR4 TaxID=3158265 RepID=UPI00346633F3
MKALVYEPTDHISIQEKLEPELRPGEVLIKVKCAGICGSDIVAWQGGFKRIQQPVILGHEIAGEIVKIYDQGQNGLSIGDRVVYEPLEVCGECEACLKGSYNVCRNIKVIGLDRDGGFTSYVRVPIERIHRLPATLPDERAVFCEPVAVAVHMVQRAGLRFGQTVAVFGAGPIGMLVAMVARRAGASKILVADINPYRLGLAEDLGFDVLDAKEEGATSRLQEYFGKEGADVSFELAASKQTVDWALDVTKIRGTILSGGIFKSPPPVDLQKITLKELHLVGTRLYTFSDFEAAIDLLNQMDFPVEKLISKYVSLDEAIDKGFQAIVNGEDVMKVLIKP